MTVVTSYESPDLDGVACAVGYAEFLNQIGKSAVACMSGKLGLETEFVEKFLGKSTINKIKDYMDQATEFVLVDTADPDAIDKSIDLNKVVRIFDHRELVFLEKFVNAKSTIDLVGSCATLITEEFMHNKQKPSYPTAVLLHSAITSNTVNFRSSLTTPRDTAARDFLQTYSELENKYFFNMFKFKSQVDEGNLQNVIEQDFATKQIGSTNIGIAQLEIVELQSTFAKLKSELIKVLENLKKSEQLDYILFTGIDVLEGYNVFFTIDELSHNFFADVLGCKPDGSAQAGVIMRKQIWPNVGLKIKK